MNAPTDKEIEPIVEMYRWLFAMDNRRAPSAETKKHLASIEYFTGKMIESLVSANERAVQAIAARVPPILSPIDPHAVSRVADLQEFVNFASALKKMAHDAREAIAAPKGSSKSAPRVAAMSLHVLFSKHSIKFSATADGYGNVSQAVAALLDIAHRAGDAEMTLDAARKWIELTQRLSRGVSPRECV